MTTSAVSIPACPKCRGERYNLADAGEAPILECGSCGAISHEATPVMAASEAELLPPPDDDDEQAEADEELLAPLDDDEPLATKPVELGLATAAELLPADSPLPLLIRFVPNPALRVTADADAERLLALQVTDDPSCAQMDQALARQRGHKTAIEQHFEEPTAAANRLHKTLTGQRSQFLERSEQAIKQGGDRIWNYNKRKEREVEEQRRRDQEEANRQARADAEREAEAAKAAGAPATLIEQLQEQAQTITAPPVTTPVTTPRETLRSNVISDTWKVRLEGTPASALVLQPEKTAEMTDAERASVLKLLKAIVDGKAPISLVRVDWTTANQRVKADKGTLAIAGLVAYEASGGTRGKSTRAK